MDLLNHHRRSLRQPRMFSALFVVLLVLILTIWTFGGAMIYLLITNPEMIGEFMGAIVRGFNASSGL